MISFHLYYRTQPALHFAGIVLTIFVICCALSWGPNCAAQPPDAIDVTAESPEHRKIVRLLSQLETIDGSQMLQSVDAFDSAWALAVQREDPLLNLNTDLQQVLESGQSRLDVGARAKLLRVFEAAPAEFRKLYRVQIALPAKQALAEAVRSTNINDLIQGILRYQFTEEGQHAIRHLIRLRLSRGELLQSALQFGRLLRLREDDTAASKAQLALLWWRAGLQEEAVDGLRRIVQRDGGDEVVVAGKTVQLPNAGDNLSAWLRITDSAAAATRPQAERDWLQPLGNYRRTQNQPSGPPDLAQVWSVPSFSCIEFSSFNPVLSALAASVDADIDTRRDHSDTVIPVALPIITDDLLIFRAAANIRAVDRATGECVWETIAIDRQMSAIHLASQKSEEIGGGMFQLQFADVRKQLVMHWLRANAGGQITCDSRTVFAVEESTGETMRLNLEDRPPTPLKATNYLRAYDLESGMLRGQAGGPIGTSETGGAVNSLPGMYFLGAPLVMGDRIYVVAESDQGIFLLQLRTTPLEPGTTPLRPEELPELDMRPVRSQLLSIPRHPLRTHPLRKYAGIIPSYGRGVLICNTCDEQIMAVSAEDHSVRWIYRYPSNVTVPELNRNIAVIGSVMGLDESNAVDLATRWTDCLPRIVGDRVLVTPRDSDLLLCLDLTTGRELWSRPRGTHRTISAVTDHHVFLTGSVTIECLSIDTGQSVWASSLDDGRISGTAVANENTLQIPTSAPAIVTLDLKTGRRLLSQPVNSTPGNLVSSHGQVFSQSVTTVTRYGGDSETPPSSLTKANQHFLAGHVDAGEESLRAIIDAGSADGLRQAKKLLLSSLMEGLRLDYGSRRKDIPEAHRLIDSIGANEQEVTDFIHSALGMTLADTTVLPIYWESINRSQQELRKLEAIVADGQLQNLDESPDALAELILRLLDEASSARTAVSRNGNLAQRSDRVIAAKISAALRLRTGDTARQIRKSVNAGLLERLQKTHSDGDAQWWLEKSLLCGLPKAVVDAAADDEVLWPESVAAAIKKTALTMLADSKDSAAAQSAATILLHNAGSTSAATPIADVLDRSLGTALPHGKLVLDNAPGLSLSRYGVFAANAATTEQLQAARDALPAQALAAPWQGEPVVTESDARSVTPMLSNNAGSVLKDLPFFGAPGNFGGWEFLMTQGQGNEVRAFDQAGRPRWTVNFGEPLDPQRRPFQPLWSTVTGRYVLAWGNLLAIKINHDLSVFDCSRASFNDPPKRLWKTDIRAFTGRFTPGQLSSRGFERTTQFDMQPSGLFPVGPLTPHGISIYGGQRLVMLNAFTGRQEWQVRGLPRDCRLTATDDHVLLISEATAQVEVRDLIDGSLQKVVALPDWWTDASENSGSSVYTYQMEDGEELRWRIAVLDGHCLVYRRNTKSAALESHDLSNNTQSFSIPLPADSLVSNPVNGHVAVLSNTNRLQIYNLHRGTQTADVEVPAAPEGTYLYLRSSGGQWLVITDTAEKDSDSVYPVQASVVVNGHVYSVRQQDGTLSWTAATNRQWLRTLRAPRGPLPPTAPFLTLLQRWFPQAKEEGLRVGPLVYRAQVLDARTGKILYEDDDVGIGLNYLWTRLNPKENTIELSFDKRVVTLDYGSDPVK